MLAGRNCKSNWEEGNESRIIVLVSDCDELRDGIGAGVA